MERQYNFIYSEIVQGEDDFIGHIAYSLYKRDKIAFIENFKSENERNPTEEDLKPFHIITSGDNIISSYRTTAENILNDFVNVTLSEITESLEREISDRQQDVLRDIIEPIKPPSFWGSVGANIIANIIAAVLMLLVLGVLLFVNYGSKNGWDRALKEVTGYEVVKSDTTSH